MPRKMIEFTRAEFQEVHSLLHGSLKHLERFDSGDKNKAVDRVREAILKLDDVNREHE